MISLREWNKSEDTFHLEGRDRDYIQGSVNEEENDPIELIPTKSDEKYKIRPKNIVGAISLPSGKTIHIEPKFKTKNFLRVISYSRDFPDLETFDKRTKVEEGLEFVDLIAKIFHSEAKKILNRGLLKTYREKRETMTTLRGRVLFQEQFRNNLCQTYQATCEYDDLTVDVLENRAILFSAHILSKAVESKELKPDMNRLALNLKQFGVNLTRVRPEEVREINITRLNDYYSFILDVCELVLKHIKIKALWEGDKVPISSVLVETPSLFEDFLTEILRNELFDDYDVCFQKDSIDNLIEPLDVGGWEKLGHRKMRPDILVKQGDDIKLVIDAKYKTSQKKSDIYQAVAYSLSKEAPTVLVYPEDEEEVKGGYEIVQAEGQNIYILTIDLNTDAESLEDFIEKLSEDLEKDLQKIMENQNMTKPSNLE